MKFKTWEQRLSDSGYDVINPFNIVGILTVEDAINHEPMPHDQYMRPCIKVLCDCYEAAFMPCWINSKGARMELNLCLDMNIKPTFLSNN